MQTFDTDTTTIIGLDFDYAPPCDGLEHDLGNYGHTASAAASWVLVMPCCGPKLLICDSRKRFLIAGNGAICTIHNRSAIPNEIRFLPIDNAGA